MQKLSKLVNELINKLILNNRGLYMYIFIEFWKAKESWLDLPHNQKKEFIDGLIRYVEDSLSQSGIQPLALGECADVENNAAPYQYFAVWEAPTKSALNTLQQAVSESGWYNFFDQINAAGVKESVSDIFTKQITRYS
jgi:carbohydrate-binding DOMON domain-containing protein